MNPKLLLQIDSEIFKEMTPPCRIFWKWRDKVFWAIQTFLFMWFVLKEKHWPKDLSLTKKHVASSDKDLLSWSKQVNDAFTVYYRKKIKVFNRDRTILFRERVIITCFKNLFFYFQTIIPRLYFLLALLQMTVQFWVTADGRTAGELSEDSPLPHQQRRCDPGAGPLTCTWLPLASTFAQAWLSVFKKDTELFFKPEM